jgi:MFS family permease
MTDGTGAASEPQAAAPIPAQAKPLVSARSFMLILLLVVYISNYADRQILNVLAVQIMADLKIGNTEFGFLSGLSFALFYATLGIPIAMLADRFSRKWILIGSMIVWSVMTTVCGMAQGFWQLALARIGVGVGEAGGSPPSHSMISDLFAVSQRGTALAIYSLGVPLGTALGNLVGGQIGEAWAGAPRSMYSVSRVSCWLSTSPSPSGSRRAVTPTAWRKTTPAHRRLPRLRAS